MQQAATAAALKETGDAVLQLGAYVVLTLGFFAFVGWLTYRRLLPKWIKDGEDQKQRDREREEWARQQVERAQARLDQIHDKIPAALNNIAQRMEENNRLNQEALTKLFDQHTKIIERLQFMDPRETRAAGRTS